MTTITNMKATFYIYCALYKFII